ncbi:MAG: penicillin-binding protein 2 [Lachnospiraceae bacterium]|nr:penicillin-binding protein 2 [Lachnospiraceae bacterium]
MRRKRNRVDEIELIDFGLDPETTEKRTPFSITPPKLPKMGRAKGRYMLVTYGFFGLFLCLCVYFVYYVGFVGEDFINNPYNPRLQMFSETTIRGDILASDETVLATSELRSDGTEMRVYPKGRVFSHVVGFSSNGMAGLELMTNFHLLRSHAFFVEKLVSEFTGKKLEGDSVVSSLDPGLSERVYQLMVPYEGAVVALDPTTGKVLCRVSKPDFEPASIETNWSYYASDSGSSVLLNRATQGLYPPGSTLKILTGLEYLREGGSLYDPFQCSGSITEGDTTIHCYRGAVHGDQTFEEAFGNSCNCVFAEVGLSEDRHELERLMAKALFNRSLPTDIKPVARSEFSLENADQGLVMQTAIGQGQTLVTPLHMAMIASAIANDGVLMEPSLLLRIVNNGGTTVRTFAPKEYGRLFEETDNEQLRELMRFAVTNGTVSGVASESYEAFGKTGTAEFSENTQEAHSWFVGFAQSDQKKIAVAAILEGAGSGSEHAVPLVRSLLDYYFQ